MIPGTVPRLAIAHTKVFGSGPLDSPVIQYQYDAVGNRTALTDPAGNTIMWGYDVPRLGRTDGLIVHLRLSLRETDAGATACFHGGPRVSWLS